MMKILVASCILWLIVNYEIVFTIKVTFAAGNKVYDMTKSIEIRNGCVVSFDPFRVDGGNTAPLSAHFDLLRMEMKEYAAADCRATSLMEQGNRQMLF